MKRQSRNDCPCKDLIGPPGKKGDQGIPGVKGSKGATGPRGDSGDRGPRGVIGCQPAHACMHISRDMHDVY